MMAPVQLALRRGKTRLQPEGSRGRAGCHTGVEHREAAMCTPTPTGRFPFTRHVSELGPPPLRIPPPCVLSVFRRPEIVRFRAISYYTELQLTFDMGIKACDSRIIKNVRYFFFLAIRPIKRVERYLKSSGVRRCPITPCCTIRRKGVRAFYEANLCGVSFLDHLAVD